MSTARNSLTLLDDEPTAKRNVRRTVTLLDLLAGAVLLVLLPMLAACLFTWGAMHFVAIFDHLGAHLARVL